MKRTGLMMRRISKWGILALVAFYLVSLCGLYLLQRRLQYIGGGEFVSPAEVGLAKAHALVLRTRDGESIETWAIPATAGKPTILYFFGNGGRLRFYGRKFARMTEAGNGLVAISYRGYGGSSGTPTEAGLIEDGETAYRYAVETGATDRSLVLMGDSLGTGVAVALAARHEVKALVLDSPFSSAVDIAALRYPIFPVRWLMKDQFRSDDLIGKVHAPLLILHGDADGVVPIASGRTLFAYANQPKLFVEVPGGQHVVTRSPIVLDQAMNFIDHADEVHDGGTESIRALQTGSPG